MYKNSLTIPRPVSTHLSKARGPGYETISSSMKDVCGVERGKCTACKCKAFTCMTPGGVRCEYCDHTPGQHVKIVELGECLSPRCSGGNCMKYMSESRAENSTCLYCGCEASDHKASHGQTRKCYRAFNTL